MPCEDVSPSHVVQMHLIKTSQHPLCHTESRCLQPWWQFFSVGIDLCTRDSDRFAWIMRDGIFAVCARARALMRAHSYMQAAASSQIASASSSLGSDNGVSGNVLFSGLVQVALFHRIVIQSKFCRWLHPFLLQCTQFPDKFHRLLVLSFLGKIAEVFHGYCVGGCGLRSREEGPVWVCHPKLQPLGFILFLFREETSGVCAYSAWR